MSHMIHQTKAFIVQTKNMKESNKLLYLYTEKFGLIYASMQSVRELKSKMRFHTQRFNLVELDLIAGRDIWKITGIHELFTSFQFAGTDAYALLDNIGSTILRLCQGEESNELLWNIIEKTVNELVSHTKSDLEIIEILVIARILFALGYWDSHETEYLDSCLFTPEAISWAVQHKQKIVNRINQGLKASQL